MTRKKVFLTLVDMAEEAAFKGRRNSSETLMGLATSGPFDSALGELLRGLAQYADDHESRYGSPLGQDYVLGAAWETALRSAVALLNGETGRLDCGDVDGIARALHRAAGFEGEL